MIYLVLGALALLALAPLLFALWRAPRMRDRGEADLALYRAQLAELDREREAGRLDEAGHRAGTLEVQRRLLAAPDAAAAGAAGRNRHAVLVAAVLLIPAAALGLYLVDGQPDMPSATFAERREAAARDDALLADLRTRILTLDQTGSDARQGWMLLGNAEQARGHADAALDAWKRAQAVRFDPGLAAQMAELELGRDNTDAARALLQAGLAVAPRDPRLRFLEGFLLARTGRNAEAKQAWQSLLADSPPDAPWRALVQSRLAELP